MPNPLSHELRTPLNAATSGISLLNNELAGRDTEEDADLLDVVQDVSLSLTTTIDILNDLLTFEKVSGNVCVHCA